MGIFKFVTQGFIDFFGITQPTPQQERRAAWFICGMLALILAGAALAFTVIVMMFGR
jgi:hypothetical protein